jgi:hypothetical protein
LWDSVVVVSKGFKSIIMPLFRDFQKNTTHVWRSAVGADFLTRIGPIDLPGAGRQVKEYKFSNIRERRPSVRCKGSTKS